MCDTEAKKILFVCIGNTCRSPMAESVMRDLVRKSCLNWEIDSAGLRSWNVGRTPQERCVKVLAEHGLKTSHLGRELEENDYQTFDYIFGMDDMNIEELNERSPPKCKAKIELLGSYIGRKEDEIIVDPYFEHGIGGFRRCYEQIYTSCKNFLATQI
ncbi:low molecular weight phosphotyrosine protein phosphatase 1 [Eupeodes corollae]|uniref:low molecular weight phosphotyrosine protein phosphatase 1 n=1 Tax=Eupeodes corollae TaxID=290404 RepID=UPI002492D9F5|nr:low molecular weight phosphotyrosine protein phosphatase 1 [Eupeodes corollae]